MFRRFDFFSKIILVMTLLFGLPFLGIGLYEACQNLEMINFHIKTRAVVVANTYSTSNVDGNVSGAYFSVVEFYDLDGKKVRYTEGIGSLPADFEVGDPVEIFYNPQDTKEVRINTWKRLWLAPSIFCVVGLLPFIIGIFVVRKIESSFHPI